MAPTPRSSSCERLAAQVMAVARAPAVSSAVVMYSGGREALWPMVQQPSKMQCQAQELLMHTHAQVTTASYLERLEMRDQRQLWVPLLGAAPAHCVTANCQWIKHMHAVWPNPACHAPLSGNFTATEVVGERKWPLPSQNQPT